MKKIILTSNSQLNEILKLTQKINTDISIYNAAKNEILKQKTLKAIEYNKRIVYSMIQLINADN